MKRSRSVTGCSASVLVIQCHHLRPGRPTPLWAMRPDGESGPRHSCGRGQANLRRSAGSAAEGGLAPQSEVSPFGCVQAVDRLWTALQSRRPSPSPSLYRRTVDRNGLSIRCATQAAPRPTSECAARRLLRTDRSIASRRRILMRMRPVSSVPERELTSVCAGQQWYGAPRRNRTGDTILTMNLGNGAVPLRVFAAQRKPCGAHVWDQSSSQVSSSMTTGWRFSKISEVRDARDTSDAWSSVPWL
jgi:hypothetical protein